MFSKIKMTLYKMLLITDINHIFVKQFTHTKLNRVNWIWVADCVHSFLGVSSSYLNIYYGLKKLQTSKKSKFWMYKRFNFLAGSKYWDRMRKHRGNCVHNRQLKFSWPQLSLSTKFYGICHLLWNYFLYLCFFFFSWFCNVFANFFVVQFTLNS